jgi:hypothetical protein
MLIQANPSTKNVVSGARLVVPVLGVVVDAAGDVWHLVEKPLATGIEVTGRVGFEGQGTTAGVLAGT